LKIYHGVIAAIAAIFASFCLYNAVIVWWDYANFSLGGYLALSGILALPLYGWHFGALFKQSSLKTANIADFGDQQVSEFYRDVRLFGAAFTGVIIYFSHYAGISEVLTNSLIFLLTIGFFSSDRFWWQVTLKKRARYLSFREQFLQIKLPITESDQIKGNLNFLQINQQIYFSKHLAVVLILFSLLVFEFLVATSFHRALLVTIVIWLLVLIISTFQQIKEILKFQAAINHGHYQTSWVVIQQSFRYQTVLNLPSTFWAIAAIKLLFLLGKPAMVLDLIERLPKIKGNYYTEMLFFKILCLSEQHQLTAAEKVIYEFQACQSKSADYLINNCAQVFTALDQKQPAIAGQLLNNLTEKNQFQRDVKQGLTKIIQQFTELIEESKVK
jgi:hypothetical protein